MADITQIGGGGPVEIAGTVTTKGAGTHSGTNTFSGTVIHNGNCTHSGHTTQTGPHAGGSTVTTATTGGAALGSEPYQLVTSTDGNHKVELPLAHAAGQLIVLLNTGAGGQAVDVRNNADDAHVIENLGAGKVGVCISTASGDNWTGYQTN
jgi:hypothetical protein